jgi:anaerobic selenocysteine-containing dehydrogenase
MSEKRSVICTVCDKMCPLEIEVDRKANRVIGAKGLGNPAAICMKPHFANDYLNHERRLLYPLKNIGKRGEQKWQRLSWEQALDEIAERLSGIVATYGAEALAVSSLPVNAGVDQGMTRRLMNLLGSPNWISGLSMCMGNTAQVHRATVGWYLAGNYDKAKCIVYIGHNPHQQNWVSEYQQLLAAKKRGAKLIVLGPRRSQCAQMADIHLPLRYGTDAAMLLGWLNVIITEGLYDKKFVQKWTVGFDELRERVQEYPPQSVAQITGCDEDAIRAAARLYATAGPSIIPWSVNFDMSLNSTSAIRCHVILAAICGFINNTEMLAYPASDIVTISEVEMHEALPADKKRLQLGSQTYPLFTYSGLEPLEGPTERVYGRRYCNVIASYMAHPPTVFAAMRTGSPYPVKAFFALGNNTLMSYANQQGIHDALMAQDLVVAYDHLLTPTAQLADYVLPGDAWLERESLFPPMDVAPMTIVSQKALEAPGECKDQYFLIKGLADRLGLGEHFPWADLRAFMEWRIQGSGQSWEQYESVLLHGPAEIYSPLMMSKPAKNSKAGMAKMLLAVPFAKPKGLATPSGKVELKSSLLEGLGYDPLPYYQEPRQSASKSPELAAEFPLTLFVGLREGPFYNTNLRHIEGLRKVRPNPLALLHPHDASAYGIKDGDWTWVQTTHGRVKMMACLDDAQPQGTLCVPHGWWLPEAAPGENTGYSGAMLHNDGMLISDEDWNLNPEQGLPNLRGGLLAKVYPFEDA